jgi:hypothetical protein
MKVLDVNARFAARMMGPLRKEYPHRFWVNSCPRSNHKQVAVMAFIMLQDVPSASPGIAEKNKPARPAMEI